MDADVTVFAVQPICQYPPWAQTLGRGGPDLTPSLAPGLPHDSGHSGSLAWPTLGSGDSCGSPGFEAQRGLSFPTIDVGFDTASEPFVATVTGCFTGGLKNGTTLLLHPRVSAASNRAFGHLTCITWPWLEVGVPWVRRPRKGPKVSTSVFSSIVREPTTSALKI